MDRRINSHVLRSPISSKTDDVQNATMNEVLSSQLNVTNLTILIRKLLNEEEEEEEEKGDPAHHPIFLIQIVLFTVICITGLLGNSLVIYVVIRYSKMQTVTNMYIVNLAIADECFLFGLPFLITTMLKNHWVFGHVMCKVYMILSSLNQYTSSMFILIISADRYVAVCHSIVSPRYRTPLISKILSALAWLCSICLIIPIIMYTTTINKEHRDGRYTSHCITDWNLYSEHEPFEESSNGETFILYSSVFGFVIPLSMIFTFYCLIIHKLFNVGPKNKSADKRKSQLKITKLVLGVVSLYIVCWTPYWTMQLLMFYNFDEGVPKYMIMINTFSSCLSYSNSAINPILYAFLSDNFRKSFMKAFTCVAAREVNKTLNEDKSVFPKKNSNAFFKSTGGETELTNIGGKYNNGCEFGNSVEDLKRRASSTSNLVCHATNIENVVETTSL